jgi:hypothetical protein
MQAADEQSPLSSQRRPAAQSVHDPPQSTSLSEPFLAPSEHVAAEHVPAAEHRKETQSPSHRQTAPVSHPSHEPPQSWSLSVPFFA